MQTEFVNWIGSLIGQHLDYDQAYGFQCVDFFNFCYQHISGDSPYSDGYSVPGAKDLWDVANDRFTKIPDSNSLVPQPGDIAVYGAAWGAGYGHVEVVESTDANGCTFIGENEHGNPQEGVVRVYRTFAQMRGLIGVMRYNWPAPAPAVQVEVHPYTIENIPPKQIIINKATHQWGMTFDNFTAINANPVRDVAQGEVITVNAICHHNIGYNYYLPDANDPTGYNVADCDDYVVVPPQPVPAPAPYVPPAAPVPVNKAEKYEVFTNLPAYASADEVAKAKNPLDIVQPGSYYVWDKQGSNGNYWNVSHSNSKDENLWINIVDNKKPLNVPVPKPAPATITIQAAPVEKPVQKVETTADIMASWKWFYKSHEPVEYKVAKDYVVRDIVHGGRPIPIHKDRTIETYGTFTAAGVTYLRPLTGLDEQGLYNMYGIPTTDIYTGLPILNNEFNVGDKVYYGIDLMIDKSKKTIEGVFRWISKHK